MLDTANPALVLNADFRPLSYFPLSTWKWKTVVRAVLTDRVSVLSYYDCHIKSPSISLRLPSVIALKDYIKPASKPAFTRFNVFLRDKLICQYCSKALPAQYMTFDHVIPKSQGGETSWENVVSACAECNFKKGGRCPEQANMILLNKPIQPSNWLLQDHGRSFPPNYLHVSWLDFLYWDTELEN